MLLFPTTDHELGVKTLEFLIEIYEQYEVDAQPVRDILALVQKKETIQ
jgi:hypothetical protein